MVINVSIFVSRAAGHKSLFNLLAQSNLHNDSFRLLAVLCMDEHNRAEAARPKQTIEEMMGDDDDEEER